MTKLDHLMAIEWNNGLLRMSDELDNIRNYSPLWEDLAPTEAEIAEVEDRALRMCVAMLTHDFRTMENGCPDLVGARLRFLDSLADYLNKKHNFLFADIYENIQDNAIDLLAEERAEQRERS